MPRRVSPPRPSMSLRQVSAAAEAAGGRVERDVDVALERAVAVGRGEQVEPAPLLGPVQQGVAGRQRGAAQHRAALLGGQVRLAGLQQHLGALGHGQRHVLALAGQDVGQLGLHQLAVGGPVGVRVDAAGPLCAYANRVSAVVPVCACRYAAACARAAALICAFGRVVEGRGGERGGQDAAADHVDRRVHAGHDPGVGEVEGAGDQLLEALRHGVGVGERGEVDRVGVPAGEAAVVGRGGAALAQQLRRDDDLGVVDREAERVDGAGVDDLAVLGSSATGAGTGRRTCWGCPRSSCRGPCSPASTTAPRAEVGEPAPIAEPAGAPGGTASLIVVGGVPTGASVMLVTASAPLPCRRSASTPRPAMTA